MYIDFGKANPEANMDRQCYKYTDCFNCTLSNCAWRGGSQCEDTGYLYKSDIIGLTVTNFFNEAPKCGDPLGICTQEAINPFEQRFGFGKSASGLIPTGYFCLKGFGHQRTEFEDLTPQIWTNRTKQNELVVARQSIERC